MKRPSAVIVLLVLLAGCTSRKPLAPDPFFGRTAIAPPATGAVQSARDPGYSSVSRPSSAEAGRTASVGVIPDPADSWTSKDKSSNSIASNSAAAAPWDASGRTTTNVPAAPSASYVDNTTAPVAGNRSGRLWPANRTSSSGLAGIRTRIQPPDYRQRATTPIDTAALESAGGASPPSAAGVASVSTDRSAAAGSGQQQIVILQPLATAATGQLGQTGQAATPSGAGAAVAPADASGWTSRSPAGGTAVAAGNVQRTSATAPTTSLSAPRQIVLPEHVTDIMELPNRGTRAAGQARIDRNVRPTSASIAAGSGQSRVVRAQSAVRLGNSLGGAGGVQGAQTGSPAPSLRYGHDPGYGWLRGKLEYSEIAKRWRLRYIPIGGKADQFGGSVVLGESTLLAGQRQGDFIEVRGRLLAGENGDWGYAAVYQVAQLWPIGK